MQQTVNGHRFEFKQRSKNLNVLFQKHIMNQDQEDFIESFDLEKYHKNMTLISKPKPHQERPVEFKESEIVLKAIEEFDFFHKIRMITVLTQDHVGEKNETLRTIINLNF